MRLQRDLDDDEKQQLNELNCAVTLAISRRREWLDAKMEECSRLKVGDDIFDAQTGQRLGTVRRIYRFWRDRDEGVRDTSLDCQYEYETAPRCFDNTSRQVDRSFAALKYFRKSEA